MKYSIITPVYNRADCISRCLDSVIRNLQWGLDLEHVVVDDGSHDETPSIVQQYADKYPHIKFVQFPENRGTNAARNAAIKAADGDYCIILDSDDYFVDDALKIIDDIISTNSYKHYCFGADDMIEFYNHCPLLKGREQIVLSYENFLYEEVVGDYVHCIWTDTLKKYPFDEDLRIYEGVFFKRFYREAKVVLYINKTVTIRERNRGDSVTRSVLRNNRQQIAKGLVSKQLLVDWFNEDLKKKPIGRAILIKSYKVMLDCNLMLANYKKAKECKNRVEEMDGNIPIYLKIIYLFRLGTIYFYAGCVYVWIKYSVFKSTKGL